MTRNATHCAACDRPFSQFATSYTPGYGTVTDTGDRLCYPCIGERDREKLQSTGKGTLYLDQSGHPWRVTNWPGTLAFNVISRSESRHNFARVRYDVWFRGPGGKIWHGYQIGDMTQSCHVRRTVRDAG